MAAPRSLRAVATEPNNVVNTAFHLFRSSGELSLVFEGITDRRFWMRFVLADRCRVEVVGTKSNVIEASKIISGLLTRFPQYASYGPFALGIADIDYDAIHSQLFVNSALRYVQQCPASGNSRDLEVVILRSRALYDYLLQEDLEEQTDLIRTKLFVAGARIGALRLLATRPTNLRSPFGEMKNLPWDVFFNTEELTVDLAALASALGRGERLQQSEIDDLVKDALLALTSYSESELTRGHDLVEMLSQYLALIKRRPYHVSEVDKDLRLAFGLNYVRQERIYSEIVAWGANHSIVVLRDNV